MARVAKPKPPKDPRPLCIRRATKAAEDFGWQIHILYDDAVCDDGDRFDAYIFTKLIEPQWLVPRSYTQRVYLTCKAGKAPMWWVWTPPYLPGNKRTFAALLEHLERGTEAS